MTSLLRTVVAGIAMLVTTSSFAHHTSDHLNYEALKHLDIGQRQFITNVNLGDGRETDLLLSRFEVLDRDAVILADNQPIQTDVVLLRGRALDDPNSQVFLGLSEYGAHGFVRGSKPTVSLSTGPWSRDQQPVLHATRTVGLEVSETAGERGCLTDDTMVITPMEQGEVGFRGDDPPCRAVRMAIDTDYEFAANLFGGDVDAAAAYAITLFAADSEIYRGQLNTRFVISYLRLWSTNSDPYAGTDIGTTLSTFREHWNGNQSQVERDLAHILSGGSGGGVAWVGVVCHPTYGYGASRVNGFFPMPVETNHPDNWDLIVTCHEIGHNFGTGHTHDYDPQIDNCAGGDCEHASEGTIMSYCHLCPGGINNMALQFHPTVRQTILNYLDGTCDLTTSDLPIAVDDAGLTIASQSLELDVLLNDLAASCTDDGVSIAGFDPVSAEGGTIQLRAGEGPAGRDLLRYIAPLAFTGIDTFTYDHPSGATATVTIDVLALRAPDGPGNASGAFVNYYALDPGPNQLPDFETLTPDSSEVVPLINFPSTNGAFAGSGLSDNVGAVFTGRVSVPANGLYTFFTNSDDGSRLYIGDELIVDNDGLHGMVERSGLAALAAGDHAVRVEFFENGGGAGLIVSFEGPNVTKQVIPAGNWSHQSPCSADIDGNDVVDVNDLLEMLANWGPCIGCSSDIDGNDNVDVNDLLSLLAQWGDC